MNTTDQNYYFFNSEIIQDLINNGQNIYSSSTPAEMVDGWFRNAVLQMGFDVDRIALLNNNEFRETHQFVNTSRINAYKKDGNVLLLFTQGHCKLAILYLSQTYKSPTINIHKGLTISLGSLANNSYAQHLHNISHSDLPYKSDGINMGIRELVSHYYKHIAVQLNQFSESDTAGVMPWYKNLHNIESRLQKSCTGVTKICYYLFRNHIQPLLLADKAPEQQLNLLDKMDEHAAISEKAKVFNNLFLLCIGSYKLLSISSLLKLALKKPQFSILMIHDVKQVEYFQAKMLHPQLDLEKSAFRESLFYTIEKTSGIDGYNYDNEPQTLIELYIKYDDITNGKPFNPYDNFFECKMYSKLHGKEIATTTNHQQVADILQYQLKESMIKVMKETLGPVLR